MRAIVDQALPILLSLGAAAMAAIASAVLRQLLELLRARAAGTRWEAAMDRVDTAARTGLLVAEQTIVAELKRASADGRLTAAEAASAMAAAISAARAALGPKQLEEIRKDLQLEAAGQVQELLRLRTEAMLASMRAPAPVPA